MCNLLYRRLVEVLEHFPESPQLEKSLARRLSFALTKRLFNLERCFLRSKSSKFHRLTCRVFLRASSFDF